MKNVIQLPKLYARQQIQEYRFDFHPDKEETSAAIPARGRSADLLCLLVRLAGVVLLLFGLWAGLKIILEGFHLYRDPAGIEVFAQAIERGSNIDLALAPSRKKDSIAQENFRMSYFAAWAIVFMLFLFISMVAFSAVKTGVELVFYGFDNRVIK